MDQCKIEIETKGQYQKTPFLCAASKGQLAIAKRLKQRGANINQKNIYESNALHLSCFFSGNIAMITWLLDVCKLDIKTKGRYQKTPFLYAVQKGRLAVAKLLRQRGANIKAKDIYGNNALHLACLHSGSVAIVAWLLDECKIGLETKGGSKGIPFFCAVVKGQLSIAKLLRQRGANINAKDTYGNNALHLACLHSGSVAIVAWLLDECKIGLETKGGNKGIPFLCAVVKGQLSIAKLLRQRGANINAKDTCGNNALHKACQYSGSVEMVTWLLDECKLGIEAKGRYQKTPFLCASEKGQLAIAKLLRQRGANTNAKDRCGNNALHYACQYSGSVEMVTWLLDVCKIDIEAKGRYQKTPFLCASEKGQLNIAKLLKQRHATITEKNTYEDNALHSACRYSRSVAMIKWLLDVCKIGIETKGYHQKTPFLCASEKGQLNIAKLLKQRKANIKAKNSHGNNALHLACLFSGSGNTVTWLLDTCKLGIENKGRYGKTPFLCAAEKGRLNIAKLLKQRKANIKAKSEHGNNALHLACLYSGSENTVAWLLDTCKLGIEDKGRYQKTPFLCAAGGAQIGIAKLLKERGANINATDVKKNNALHLACLFSGSEAMITWLLDLCKIGKESKGQDKMTPFLCAIQEGQLPIAKLLRQRGVNINAKDEDKNDALHYACSFSGSQTMTTWLLDVCKLDIETKGQDQITPFLCAANKGQLAIAKLLKQRGATINAKSEDGDNALHLACFYSTNIPMMTWLLDVCNLSIETKGRYQRTPFLCAAGEGQLAIAKLLKQRGATINAKDEDKDSALHYACAFSGSEAMVTWLLHECKIPIETKGQYKKTPFLFAAEKGQLDIAKLLKQQGANINAKNTHKNNALHLACLYSASEAMTTWLLDECKIPIETKGQYERTPFLCAAQKGQLSIAKLLKQRNANINAKDKYGNNTLHYASLYSESEAMATWLLDVCKLDIETKGRYQRTPFLCAAEKGQLAIAKLLRQRGANVNAKDKDGNNALNLARSYANHRETVNWLQTI